MDALQAFAVGSIPSDSTTHNDFMLHKLKQNTLRYRFTSSNRLPLRRARQFLLNHIRMIRLETSSAPMRAAMGLIR